MSEANGKSLAVSPQQKFQQIVEGRKASIAAVLPSHLKGREDALVKSAMLAMMKNQQLASCTPQSVATALVQAAQLGFTDVSGTLGHAYLVPYSGQCQLITGYRGMLDLARRSGEIASVTVRGVFKGDEFEMVLGDDERFTHKPNPDSTQDPKDLIGAYCIARFKDGGVHRQFMSRKQIDAVKKNSGPWRDHYVEMALKTVMRRAFKWWPMSLEIQRDLTEMAQRDDGKAVAADILDVEVVPDEPDAPALPASVSDAVGIGSESAQPPAEMFDKPAQPVGTVGRVKP